MTNAVKRSVPPAALIRLGNPLVRLLALSPLHGMLDGSVVLLHVTGRKTGRRYDVPVGYVDMEGKLAVVTIARWRGNLQKLTGSDPPRQLGGDPPWRRARDNALGLAFRPEGRRSPRREER